METHRWIRIQAIVVTIISRGSVFGVAQCLRWRLPNVIISGSVHLRRHLWLLLVMLNWQWLLRRCLHHYHLLAGTRQVMVIGMVGLICLAGHHVRFGGWLLMPLIEGWLLVGDESHLNLVELVEVVVLRLRLVVHHRNVEFFIAERWRVKSLQWKRSNYESAKK